VLRFRSTNLTAIFLTFTDQQLAKALFRHLAAVHARNRTPQHTALFSAATAWWRKNYGNPCTRLHDITACFWYAIQAAKTLSHANGCCNECEVCSLPSSATISQRSCTWRGYYALQHIAASNLHASSLTNVTTFYAISDICVSECSADESMPATPC
jgi:hypothetical protein